MTESRINQQKTATTVLNQSIELRVTGQPDVENKSGSGHVRPSEVTIRYQTAGMRAHVCGRWVRPDGELTDEPRSQSYTARQGDTSNWPEWLVTLAAQYAPSAAHAREDVDAMAAEIRRLRTELADMRATVLNEVADELDGIDFHPNAKSPNGELCRLLAGRFRRQAAAVSAARP
ncbi:hypothetical protein AB0K09_15710 [Streptomyces sp. NPDC049577]|uniref:hypothetical protein n=1 Tax=Streptomyces sp. NPDC049577 TaxID=3155153 RepID=UPI003448CD5D